MGVLDGRVALVTGASRGIGAAIAVALGREGAVVGVNYHRSEAQAAAVMAAIQATGGKAVAIRADVRDGAAVRAMVGEMLAIYGRIDVLVNNAGILNDVPLHEMSEETWGEMMATNLGPVFLCSRAVLPHMLERGSGKIINMSSLLARKGCARAALWGAGPTTDLMIYARAPQRLGLRGIWVDREGAGLAADTAVRPHHIIREFPEIVEL